MAAGPASTAAAPRLGAPRVGSELESHLAGCARCREELEALRKALALVDAELHQLVAVGPSPDLAARIRRAAAENAAEPARRPTWLWPALAAAAVLLLAVAVLATRPSLQATVAITERPVAGVTATPEPPRPPKPETTAAPVPATVETGRAILRVQATVAQVRRSIPPAEPEVLVPPGEAAALLRLATLVSRHGAVLPALASVNDASPDLALPRAIDAESIDIKPLEIVPLDPAEANGTTAEGEGR